MPEALPAVTVPFLSNAGRSFDKTSTVVPCLGVLVGVDDGPAAAARDLDRDDLVPEAAGLLCCFGLGLRGGGERVLLIAGDLPLLGDVLRGVAHVVAVKGVPQPVLDHRVDHFGVAHLDTVPQMDAVRRLAHALLPAGDDDLESPLRIACQPSATVRSPEPHSWLTP